MAQKIKKTWHLICCNTILTPTRGMSVVKARPEGGKYIRVGELPDHVKIAFDLSQDGRHVQSFTNESVITEYEKNGAIIKKIGVNLYRITFDIEYKRTNKKASQLAKQARRNKYGWFESSPRSLS